MITIIHSIIKAWNFVFRSKNKYILNAMLNIAGEVAKLTKNKVDNAAIAYLAAMIRNETKNLDDQEVEILSELVNKKTRGSLKDIKLKFDSKKGIGVQTKFGSAMYNYDKGVLTWEKKIMFRQP